MAHRHVEDYFTFFIGKSNLTSFSTSSRKKRRHERAIHAGLMRLIVQNHILGWWGGGLVLGVKVSGLFPTIC